jgi:[ribosomal protein S5]-alanine N-acetyltransferase
MSLHTRVSTIAPVSLPHFRADWRTALPVLRGEGVTLRELRRSDAPTLLEMLTPEDVARFISKPPDTVEGFERFIGWAQHERAEGRYACFAVVPEGLEHAVGILQLRAIEPGFRTAEWGFAIGSPFWGTGVFAEAATAALEFAFDTIGANRLEARVVVSNGRGNGALAKMGAVRETVLRNSFERGGEHLDQVLWSILRHEWRRVSNFWGTSVH